VDQRAGPFALVADDLAGWIERGEPAEAEATQAVANGGDGQTQAAGDRWA
jgi:hypothetical protein